MDAATTSIESQGQVSAPPAVVAAPAPLGIIRGEDIAVYHATKATSHSKLETLRNPDRGPRRYLDTYIRRIMPPFAGTAATDFGSALDAQLLENRTIYVTHPDTYIGPASAKKDAPLVHKDWNWNANTCKAWLDAQPAGTVVLSQADAAKVTAAITAVQNHPLSFALLARGESQVTFRTAYRHFQVQVRPDWLNLDGTQAIPGETEPVGPYVMDLKTAEDMDRFLRNATDLGYRRQAALYREVIRQAIADQYAVPLADVPPLRFFFLVVFKSSPVDCMVYELTGDDLIQATMEVADDLKLLHRCYETGEWASTPRQLVRLPKEWRARSDGIADLY